MKQVSKKSAKASKPKRKSYKKSNFKRKNHPKFGTSKLEKDFAANFLDKLGVEYEWQFEAKDIGRFYDFRILPQGPIIEVNGGYYHSDPRIYEGKELNKMQKRNLAVDEYKKRWALAHGIPIYYVWEKDIKETPTKVMEYLKNILRIEEKKNNTKEDKKRRHINKIK